jgi:anti-sigma factor RsiW
VIERAHLSEEQIQGLADGTLRGPEGFAAREHCESCLVCDADVAGYAALAQRLDALVDPLPPLDFTAQVLQAAGRREAYLAQRRQTWYAAIPAAAVALIAIVGWAMSAAPNVHVDSFIETWSLMRHVLGAAGPVLSAMRLPLGLGAFVFAACVLALLARAIRAGVSGPAPASS